MTVVCRTWFVCIAARPRTITTITTRSRKSISRRRLLTTTITVTRPKGTVVNSFSHS